jgi:hypothetical protein
LFFVGALAGTKHLDSVHLRRGSFMEGKRSGWILGIGGGQHALLSKAFRAALRYHTCYVSVDAAVGIVNLQMLQLVLHVL